MSCRYTEEHLSFLRDGYKKLRIPDLTFAFNARFNLNKTETAIKSALTNHGFTCGRPRGNQKGTLIKYTKDQADYIKKHYRKLTLSNLTDKYNKHFGTSIDIQKIKAFTNNHAIRSGRTGRFIKGSKPWNAGTKGLVKPNSGNFKKGDKPKNLKPLGHERFGKDGYILVKIKETNPYTGAPTRYKAKHIVIWERKHGPIPAGHILIFKDGNKLNCVLNNLEMITRRELCLLNKRGYGEMPPEMKETLRALVKVEIKRFDLLKDSSCRQQVTEAAC